MTLRTTIIEHISAYDWTLSHSPWDVAKAAGIHTTTGGLVQTLAALRELVADGSLLEHENLDDHGQNRPTFSLPVGTR